ncbi:hypothetical protein TSUD_57010 [Trifolium subterraneum]|uniref:Uncharacterized protein n=1 Tax=Trifolium subterraneum TaxID=3900 RepID=A0A2Z6N297_TRISU|nr:hypothetical protein TSUD_57010 [Trifolium subterraneum]
MSFITKLTDELILEKISCTLGVLLIIFEFRPNALVQVITSAITDTVRRKLIGLVTSRDEIPDPLELDDVIDLVVPRCSNKLVSQIKASTKIPVRFLAMLAVKTMKKGEKVLLKNAFGESGKPSSGDDGVVPPNASLQMDLEL